MVKLWSDALRVYVGGFDLGTSTTSLQLALETPSLDKTSFGDKAETITADIRRDSVTWSGWFEDGAGGFDAMLGTLVGTQGDVLSFHIGTATGDRAYVGTVLVSGAKAVGKVGELVKAESIFKPDQKWDVGRHFGKFTTTGSVGTSGSIDHTAGTSGTSLLYAHCIALSGTTEFLQLWDSADGTTFAQITAADVDATMTGTRSFVATYTGSIRRYTRARVVYGTGATGSGTSTVVIVLRRVNP